MPPSTKSSSPSSPNCNNKRARVDESSSFDSLDAHLRQLEKDGKLVDCLRAVWEDEGNNIISKSRLVSQMHEKSNKWASVTDQNEMFQYDWKIEDDDNDDDPLLLKFASNKIRLGHYSDMVDVDVKELSGGCHIINDGGCEQCSGDEVYSFDMQRTISGKVRLDVSSYVECRCGGRDDDSNECERCDYIAYPITK